MKHAHPGAERGLCGGCDECNSDPHFATATEGMYRETVVDAPEYLRDPHFDESTKTITVERWDAMPYGLDADFVAAVDRVFAEARDLLLRKHANYGGKNISQSPGGPLNGLRVRKHDKMARLNNMLDNSITDQVGEDLQETLLDDGNYSLIGVLVLRGEWPDE